MQSRGQSGFKYEKRPGKSGLSTDSCAVGETIILLNSRKIMVFGISDIFSLAMTFLRLLRCIVKNLHKTAMVRAIGVGSVTR